VNEADLEALLSTARYGRSRELVAETTSTNDDARARAEAGARDGHLVVAGRQTAGRGSHGRAWSSPEGGLYFSLVLRPRLEAAALPPMTLAAGRAVAEAIEAVCERSLRAEVKWPNDVLIDGKKCAGILAESATIAGRLDHAIVGIGINVGPVAFEGELADSATSLPDISPVALLAEVLLGLERAVASLESEGTAPLIAALESRLAYRGERVRVAESFGRIVGLAPTGALRLETEGGIRDVVAGRIELLAG